MKHTLPVKLLPVAFSLVNTLVCLNVVAFQSEWSAQKEEIKMEQRVYGRSPFHGLHVSD